MDFGKSLVIGLGILLVIILFSMGYVKAPPDMAYIISGLRKRPKVIVGRSSLRFPFFERLDKIPLSLLQVDIKTTSAVPTAEYINIFVDGVANIKIGSDLESIHKATQNFLGRSKADIAKVAQEVLEGNMREIVGQMKLSELVQNRDRFAQMVQENAMDDMQRMGLEIINLTIQNFIDQNQVIEDLGMDNLVQIKKEAAIAKARGERDIEIAASSAKEEANNARTQAEAKIAQQNNGLLMEQARLKMENDVIQAQADAAYEIQKQEQRKQLEVASANVDIARKEREVLIQEKEIEINEKRLAADVRQKADAEKYSQEQIASAARYAKEQEAIGVKALGLAEASAIREKAEAMKLMGEASVIEMYLKVMPEIVKNAAIPLAQTEKIVMYGNGNSAGMVKDVMNSSNQVMESLSESLGLDIKQVINKLVDKGTALPTSEVPVLMAKTETAKTE